MKKSIILILTLHCVTGYGQWTFSSGKNDFDGSYKTSSITGRGGEFPYTRPLLVVNKFDNGSVNIYINNAGYSGCNDKVVYFKFKEEEEIYKTGYVNSGANNDSWFITSLKNIEKDELLLKFMKYNSLSIRLESHCGKVDYKFSLSGSTKALNFVIGDWLKQKKDAALKSLKEKKKKDSISRVNLNKTLKIIRLRDSISKVKKEEKIEQN